VEINVSQGNVYETLKACDLAMVASGTATLETAIMGVPMILVYRASLISYWAAKKVVKVPYLGLVNLVAGERVIPELIQNDLTPDRLAHEALEILEGGQKRENMIEKLRIVKERLGRGGASERTAKIALEMLTTK
jgi:lipid-A-disaccharide synthase